MTTRGTVVFSASRAAAAPHGTSDPPMCCSFLFILIIYGALGGFLFGYDLGCITAALPIMLNDKNLSLTDFEAEAVVGHCKLGAAAGALAGIYLLRRGHTLCFWLSSLGYIAGPLMLAGADGWISLAAGRLIVGIGIGLSAVASPTYLAEIAPPARRGGIVALYEVALTCGLLFASLINTGLQFGDVKSWLLKVMPDVLGADHHGLWRVMLGLPGLPAIPLFFGCLFLPETPATLVAAGQTEAALELLLRLRGIKPPRRGASSSLSRRASSTPYLPKLPSHFWRAGSLTQQQQQVPPPSPGGVSACAPMDHRFTDRSSADSQRGLQESLMRFTSGGSSHGSFATERLSGADNGDNPTQPNSNLLSASQEQHMLFSQLPRFSNADEAAGYVQAKEAVEALVRAQQVGGGSAASGVSAPTAPLVGSGSNVGIVGAAPKARVLLLTRERRGFFLMLLLAVCNQGNGSSTLLNYGAELLSDPRFHMRPQLAGLICSLAAVLKLMCVGGATIAVDRCGRRPLLLVGALLTTVGLVLGGHSCALGSAPMVVASLYLFVGAYAMSLAPIFYCLLSELFSSRTRPLAAGLCTAVTFAAGAAADMSFLTMRDALRYQGVFYAYAVVCAAGGLGVLLLLPETKGKSLAEAQALMEQPWTCCGPGGVCPCAAASPAVPATAGHEDEVEAALPIRKRSSSAFVLAS